MTKTDTGEMRKKPYTHAQFWSICRESIFNVKTINRVVSSWLIIRVIFALDFDIDMIFHR